MVNFCCYGELREQIRAGQEVILQITCCDNKAWRSHVGLSGLPCIRVCSHHFITGTNECYSNLMQGNLSSSPKGEEEISKPRPPNMCFITYCDSVEGIYPCIHILFQFGWYGDGYQYQILHFAKQANFEI